MASKKSPSIFGTLQKTTEAASAVNGEFVRQLRVSDLEDNPMNRFSMAEDEQFLSTVESVKKDGFLEDIIVTPAATEGKYRIVSGHRRLFPQHLCQRCSECCGLSGKKRAGSVRYGRPDRRPLKNKLPWHTLGEEVNDEAGAFKAAASGCP